MKKPPKKSAKPEATTPAASIVSRALAYAAPGIAVLNSPAFAAPPATSPVDGSAAPITALDPPSIIAATTAIATLGAYRLMKSRKGKKTQK